MKKPVMEVIVVVRFPGIEDPNGPQATEALEGLQIDLESELSSRGYHWSVAETLIVDDDEDPPKGDEEE